MKKKVGGGTQELKELEFHPPETCQEVKNTDNSKKVNGEMGNADSKGCFGIAYEFVIAFLGTGLFTVQGAVGVIYREFVERRKWLSSKKFAEIFTLSQPLPGTASSRIIMGIAMNRYGENLFVSIMSYVLFNGPGFIIMLLLGMIFQMDVFSAEKMPFWINCCLKGLIGSGIAFLIYCCYGMIVKIKTKFEHFVMVWVAVIGLLYRSVWTFPFLLVLGTLTTWIYLEIEDFVQERIRKNFIKERVRYHRSFSWYDSMTLPLASTFYLIQSLIDELPPIKTKTESDEGFGEESDDEYDYKIEIRKLSDWVEESIEEDDDKEKKGNPPSRLSDVKRVLLGLFYLLLFISMWIGLSVLALVFPKNGITLPLHLTEFFYRMGTLIFGGLRAGVPMLQYELIIVNNWMTHDQFIMGYALGNMIPGSFANVACFYGVSIASTTYGLDWYHWLPVCYGILAGVAFQVPGVLTFLSIHGMWQFVKKWKFMKKIIRGAEAVCVGYITANALMMWIKNVETSKTLAFIILFCTWLISSVNLSSPLVVGLSTLLALVFGMAIPDAFPK